MTNARKCKPEEFKSTSNPSTFQLCPRPLATAGCIRLSACVRRGRAHFWAKHPQKHSSAHSSLQERIGVSPHAHGKEWNNWIHTSFECTTLPRATPVTDYKRPGEREVWKSSADRKTEFLNMKAPWLVHSLCSDTECIYTKKKGNQKWACALPPSLTVFGSRQGLYAKLRVSKVSHWKLKWEALCARRCAPPFDHTRQWCHFMLNQQVLASLKYGPYLSHFHAPLSILL